MKKLSTIKSQLQKGFTLVELLVVIAILGILAVGLIAAIDPVDKLNASADSRVISDVGVLARASESYLTSSSSLYAPSIAELVSSKELKVAPVPPSGYSAYVYTVPVACTGVADPDCTSVTISGQLKSRKSLTTAGGGATAVAKYESSTGKQCIVATAATACP